MKRPLQLVAAVAIALCVASASAAASGILSGLQPGHVMRTTQFAAGGLDDLNGNHVQFGLQTGPVNFLTPSGYIVTVDGPVVTAIASTQNSQGLFGFGCWTVPSSMVSFNIESGVSLRFDSTAAGVGECPGYPAGAALAAYPALTFNDSLIVGFVGPIIFSATMTPSGALDTRTATINTTCGDFKALDRQDTRHFFSVPTLTVTAMTLEGVDPTTGETERVDLGGFVGSVYGVGDASEMFENLVVNGPATGSCGQFGS